jgi:hypothetical protein
MARVLLSAAALLLAAPLLAGAARPDTFSSRI